MFNATTTIDTSERTGVSCKGCNARLPVRLAEEGENPALWQCSRCDARFAGILIAGSSAESLSSLALANLHFDTSRSAPIPSMLRDLVKKLADRQANEKQNERRASRRVPKQLEAAVASLDDSMTPAGNAFSAMVHNISANGIGFITHQSLCGENVAILLRDQGRGAIQLFGRVIRVRELSIQFQEVGVQLKFRLGTGTPHK